jgi:hypothetical protein
MLSDKALFVPAGGAKLKPSIIHNFQSPAGLLVPELHTTATQNAAQIGSETRAVGAPI